nr:polyprotein [Bat picornavirus 1]
MVFFFNSNKTTETAQPTKDVKPKTMSPGPICLDMDEELLIITNYYILFLKNNPLIIPRIHHPGNTEHKRVRNCGAAASRTSTESHKNQSAHAGGNITQINYYGSDYASAHGLASTQMDPEKFTRPLADMAAAAGPALKSPNVEELGYSDRLMQLTAGNSTITTQEAASAVVAYGVWPTHDVGVGEAVDMQTMPGPAVERFYTLDSWYWTKGGTQEGRAYKLPAALTDLGVFGQNCQFHFLCRSGFCVHVQVNATKFHQGMLLVAAIPDCQVVEHGLNSAYPLSAVDFVNYPKHQLTLYPHQLINLRTNNSATIILPYVSASPAESPLTHNNWTIYITPVVPLDYVTGSSTNVPVTISIAPMAASFSGLRNSVRPSFSVHTQGVPVFEVPGSSQFVTTLRNSGYPMLPDYEETPSHHIPGRVTNLLEVMQVDTFCNPVNSSNAAVSFTLDVSNNNVTNAAIAHWDMDMGSVLFSTTYMARCARWYSQHRGGIRVTFMFCGSAMATGKLLLAFTPPGGSAPATRRDAMLGTHEIWDLGLQSSITLVVPWISQTAYRFNQPSTSADGNVLTYRGYISVFYQTAVVVPVGAPSTCQIAVLASVTKDFVMRCPTDSAYFQGIGDELGKVITDAAQHALQPLDVKPVNGPSVPPGLSIQVGDASALTAPETGATAATEAPSTLETRNVPVTYSARETEIENFFSKYALFFDGEIDYNEAKILKVPLRFSEEATTQLAVISKYRMFTYLRCGFDIVINVCEIGSAGPKTAHATAQVLYCPPGCPVPADHTSAEWFIPTTPCVYQKTSADAPISLRLPFMGPASAYCVTYDGYPNYRIGTHYGEFPGNDFGTICFRFINLTGNAQVQDIKHRILMLARPTQVSAFCPRPIVSLAQHRPASVTKGRIAYVRDGPDEVVPSDDGTDRVVRAVNCGPKPKNGVRMRPERCPEHLYRFFEDCYQCWDLDLGVSFHCFPLSPRECLIPAHLYVPDLVFSKHLAGPRAEIPYRKKWADYTMDLVCLQLAEDYFQTVVTLCERHVCKNTWTVCETTEHEVAIRCGETFFQNDLWVDGKTDAEPGHYQRNLLRVNAPIQPGHCGSPLICKHGICGMATVSDEQYTSWFTCVWMADEFGSSVDFPMVEEQGPAEEQGLRDMMNDVARELGHSFGDSTMTGVANVIEDAVKQYTFNKANAQMSYVKQIIKWLVKVVASVTMIARAPPERRIETAAGLGVIFGIDLLTTDPFEWLQDKVMSCISLRTARAQGFADGLSNWIKEFNAACTAAKGLEWIGIKISQFVDWLKSLFKKENPARVKFMQQLEDFPLMMQHLDKIAEARGKYPEDQIRKVCEAVKQLKQGADVFGVERNAATIQILKYYQKAQSILQSLTKGRTEPVAMLVHGAPGSGKSLATEIIGRLLSQRYGGSRPYSLPPDPKHFDGYAQQPVVIMDDLGQNPDGEDCKLLCQMVSSTEFIVPMAALEEKGLAFVSDFVLASTNLAQVRPPTVSEPLALKRRFFVDVNIEVQKDYAIQSGKLAADVALTPCNHQAANFKVCCPMICGKAVLFRDVDSGVRYSLDEIVTRLIRERDARKSCGSKLDALFQGPSDFQTCMSDEWLESDYDRMPPVLKTYEELRKEGIERPAPKEVIDLVKAVPTPEVFDYCRVNGWMLPVEVRHIEIKRECAQMVTHIARGLSILASLCAISGFVYLMYSVFAKGQGAYSTAPKPELKKPELRRVVKTQGPDMEFVNKLFKQSIFSVKTEKGWFSGLGLHSQWLLLPKHAEPGEEIEVNNVVYKCLDIAYLENGQGSLELVAVKIDRPVNFRDIRKYLPEHFQRESGCFLAVDNPHFERMFAPVGTVSMFGFLNLSYKATFNTCHYHYPTRSGQCGGVICKAGKIIAMHIGGDGQSGYGAILTKRIVAAIEQGEIVKMEKTETSPINLSTKTRLHPSVFYDVFPGEKEPAALHPKDPRLEVPLEEALFSKYKGNCDVKEPTPNMLVAVDHYVSQIQPIMPENLTEVLTLEEAVYGIEKLDGLDLATSAGYPYVVKGIKKKDLIPPRGEPLDKLIEALDLYGYGKPFVTYIKDELRPKKKIAAGKSRLIECSSLNDTIHMKRVFGHLFQTFHANPGTVTGSAVGCNPDVDWSKFYAEMAGRPLIAFDYSNFDASLSPVWFKCLKLVLLKLGFKDDIDKYIEFKSVPSWIIDHITFSSHLYKDKYYEVEGGMPSGCSGTSVFNSIINNIIIRTLVLDVYKGIDLDQLRMVAYGDDIVATYPFQLDAAALAEAGKAYGLQMTPPDKDSDFNDTTWENVTFLKRTFVPDEEFPFLIHPCFPMKEIYESIRWSRSAAATEEHVQSLCYLAWHNGRSVYEDFIDKIRTVPVGRALKLPSYSVLRQQWLDQF